MSSNLSIALSGMRIAQAAIELAGTNIANAGTEGYHRQDLRIGPRQFGSANNIVFGGAEVDGARRHIDVLLENELARQQPIRGQLDQELSILRLIESSLGSIDNNGLAVALNDFFGSLSQLAADPNSLPLQQQAIWSANGLASQFNHIGSVLRDMNLHVTQQALETTARANSLIGEIAQLNGEIQSLELRGGNASLLADRRDLAIQELAQLVEVRTSMGGGSVRNVAVWGTPVVSGAVSTLLETGLDMQGRLGVSPRGAAMYDAAVRGGKLGALLALRNELLAEVSTAFETLATEVTGAINQLHVQGVGGNGSFTELTSVPMPPGTLDDSLVAGGNVREGEFYIRVTNTHTQQVVRYQVAVSPGDTPLEIAQRINELSAGVTASFSGGLFRLAADAGHRFDFLPAATIEFAGELPQASTAAIDTAGVYDGSENTTIIATVVGGGQVGFDEGLSLQLRDAEGNLIKTLQVGEGYVPGTVMEVGNGIMITLGGGHLEEGETFAIHALAESDTSGFLSGAGLNTLFVGDSALNMRVNPAVLASPGALAWSQSPSLEDNALARRMAALGGQALGQLGTTPADHLRMTITNLGQNDLLRQIRQDNVENVIHQLSNQRDRLSGVDINEEAAKLIAFEQMFQAMAKFLTTQQQTTQFLMNVL